MIASERWETDPSLPELPSRLLSSYSWNKVMAKWFFDDDIFRLEAGPRLKQPSAQHTASRYTTAGYCDSVTIFQLCSLPRHQTLYPDQTFCIGMSGAQHQDQNQMDTERLQEQWQTAYMILPKVSKTTSVQTMNRRSGHLTHGSVVNLAVASTERSRHLTESLSSETSFAKPSVPRRDGGQFAHQVGWRRN